MVPRPTVQVKLYSPTCGVTKLERSRHHWRMKCCLNIEEIYNRYDVLIPLATNMWVLLNLSYYLFYEKTHLKYKSCSKALKTANWWAWKLLMIKCWIKCIKNYIIFILLYLVCTFLYSISSAPSLSTPMSNIKQSWNYWKLLSLVWNVSYEMFGETY